MKLTSEQMIIEPSQMYIDTRLGFDPGIDKRALLGSEWIMRGTHQKWLVPVRINNGGYLEQVARKEVASLRVDEKECGLLDIAISYVSGRRAGRDNQPGILTELGKIERALREIKRGGYYWLARKEVGND